MPLNLPRPARWRLALVLALLTAVSLVAGNAVGASAHVSGRSWFRPGDLVVTRSVYQGTPGLLQPGVTVLPPGCTSGCAVASNDGSYPGVWNNDSVDGTFGVASPILLGQITQSGRLVNTLPVPAMSGRGSGPQRDGSRDHMVTSFSSKSELALNLSTSGRDLTIMGYLSQPNALDVSNSNTPGVIDPTNPVPGANYRVVTQVDSQGRFHFTRDQRLQRR
jgi:hypothetical protein